MSKFDDLFPEGYFHNYLRQCAAWKLETPQPFMWMSIATCMAHLIGYRAWLQHMNPYKHYPSLNSILLSPSARCRRGGGTGLAMEILMQCKGANVCEGRSTPEGIIDQMLHQQEEAPDAASAGSRLLWYVEEMGDVFNKKESQNSIVPFLTALLCRSRKYDDITRGKMRNIEGKLDKPKSIQKPCLMALFTSAPDWFNDAMPREAKSGGLMSRLLGCHLTDRDITHIEFRERDCKLADPDIVLATMGNDLQEHVESVEGPFLIEKATNTWFQKWYHQTQAEIKMMPEGHPQTIRERQHDNVIKIAMLLAVGVKTRELNVDFFRQAIKIEQWISKTILGFYDYTDQMKNQLGRGERRVLDILNRQKTNDGWVNHNHLTKGANAYFTNGIDDFRRCMQGLVEAGKVEYMMKKKYEDLDLFERGGKYWPPRMWRNIQ